MARSDFSGPCIIGDGSSPSRCGPAAAKPFRSNPRPPSFRCDPFPPEVAFDPGGTTMPRIAALHMLRSTMKTVCAPASSSFRGSITHPTHPLCTLRVRQHCRLTQHSLPGGPLSLTSAGLAPADRASFAWRLPSLNHLVGPRKQHGRNRQAEHLGGRQIDDKIELGRLLDRDVARLHPAQNLVDKIGGAPEQVREVRSVGYQTARFDLLTLAVNCRQSCGECQGIDANLVSGYERVANNIKCIRTTLDRLEGEHDILGSPDFQIRHI